MINATHDPKHKSHVASANVAVTDFPVQNLPHGVFAMAGEAPRGGVAIGNEILDLDAVLRADLAAGWDDDAIVALEAAAEPALNRLMALPPTQLSRLRARLQSLLLDGYAEEARVRPCLRPMADARLQLPASIAAFTDFMTSAAHIAAARPARTKGRLPPPFWSLPIAYNSRASSVTVSGTPLARPWGQYNPGDGVVLGPSVALDYELEFACYAGLGNDLGQPVRLADARRHIFGYCLLNDWSARDFQQWESVLGPFQAKAFRTTVSPWVVTAEAMAPFRMPLPPRPVDAPSPPPHLRHAPGADAGFALRLTAELRTARMRADDTAPVVLTATDFANGAWSFEQMLVHHTIGGCNLRSGDLLATGTLSGEALTSAGCLGEITGGKTAVRLPNGEQRLWLEDGDELTLRARAECDGFVGIGFGECQGVVLPAVAFEP